VSVAGAWALSRTAEKMNSAQQSRGNAAISLIVRMVENIFSPFIRE
jgi:hypothetical protein